MNKVLPNISSSSGISHVMGKDHFNSSSSETSTEKSDSSVSTRSKIFESDMSEKENVLNKDISTNNVKKSTLPFKISTNVGFSKMPKQIYRKVVQRGFSFNIMLVGVTGLGKSTFMNSLFMGDIYNDENPVGTTSSCSIFNIYAIKPS